MVLTLNEMVGKEVANMKGGIGVINSARWEDDMMAIIHNIMPAGTTVGFHQHVGTSEVIYILAGSGFIKEDDELKPIKAGDVNYCAEGGWHEVIAGDEGMEILGVIPNQTR